MKVVVDARMIEHSGIGVYLKNIVRLIQPYYNIKLLGDPVLLNKHFENADIIAFDAPIYSIAEQQAYGKVIPSCDIFWSPHYNVPIFKVAARIRVVTIHDAFHLAFYSKLTVKQRLYARLLMSKAVSKSNIVLTVSNFSKNEIIKYTGCDASKIHSIHNGVKQIAEGQNINVIRDQYEIPERYILFVGNVKPHKNLKGFLKAYLLLGADIKESYKILVVGKKDGFITGDAELMTWIETNVTLSKNVTFTGYVVDEHMNAIYANASVFVFPSVYEGFGLPPLEAMLNSCPVAVSDIPALKETCGDAAIYFDPANPADIAGKIQKLLTDEELKYQLVRRGEEHIKKYTWGHAAKQHRKLFDELLSSS